MKSLLSVICLLFFAAQATIAQQDTTDSLDKIKLFLDKDSIVKYNGKLYDGAGEKIFDKTVQLISHTGIVELGYSNFLVTPKLDIIGYDTSESTLTKIYKVRCDFSLTVSRRDYGGEGGATFDYYTRVVSGGGRTPKEALTNAINSITANDVPVAAFLTKTKEKINNYFAKHCQDVIKEAKYCEALLDYGKSIALYFSIPASASCYDSARTQAILVYSKYLNIECQKYVIQLRVLAAKAMSDDSMTSGDYDKAIKIIGEISPNDNVCFSEAKGIIDNMQAHFHQTQDQKWQLKLQPLKDKEEMRREMVRAMAKINAGYVK